MKSDVVIRKDNSIILPKELLSFLNAVPGDYLKFEFLDNGDVKVEKSKFSSFLEDINQQMKEGGYFEKAGLKNEEDVIDLIRKLRDEKSSS